jgi:hypothetical protein
MAYIDFHGTAADDPKGYKGFIVSLITTLVFFMIYWGAGLFSRI